MIKIPKHVHDSYMTREFTDDEYLKIYRWIDPIITPLFEKSLDEIIRGLISLFLRLSNSSITKIFMYQLLVLNGIIYDGVHDKRHCSIRSTCKILKENMEKYNTKDPNDICWNIKICLLVPGMNIYPPFGKTEMDFVLLDNGKKKK